MAQIHAAALLKLEGTTHHLSGHSVRFDEGKNGRPAAWAGGEGYAAPVTLDGARSHFLKIYRLPSPERLLRARFLSSIDLGSLPMPRRSFEAAPVKALSGSIDVPGEGPIHIEGHLAPTIVGEPLDTLNQEGWDPDISARVALTRQLAAAVEVLESGGLVHGDLSAANVMVVGAGSPDAELRLIDFDGFHCSDIPPVPYTEKERGGRAWGTPGYRAPAFKRRADVLVTSDRVALAVLAMEIVTRRGDDELPGDTFIEQASIDARDPDLSDEIIARWPAGWELVRRAIAEEDPARAPAPAEWRRELRKLLSGPAMASVPPPPRSLSPSILVRVRENAQDRLVKLRGPRGTFALVSEAFGWLSFELGPGGVHLSGETPRMDGRRTRLFVRHGGPAVDSVEYENPISVDAAPGDVVLWDDFQVYLP